MGEAVVLVAVVVKAVFGGVVAIRAGFCQWWGIGGVWKQFPARFDGSNVYSYQSGLKCGVGGFPEGFRMKESKMEGEMEGWKKRSGMLLRGRAVGERENGLEA